MTERLSSQCFYIRSAIFFTSGCALSCIFQMAHGKQKHTQVLLSVDDFAAYVLEVEGIENNGRLWSALHELSPNSCSSDK